MSPFVLFALLCFPADGRRKVDKTSNLLDLDIGATPGMNGPQCDAETSNCDVEVAPKDELGQFHVKPGGDTTCLKGDYRFQVRLGDPRKLHIHFQGGGTCTRAADYIFKICTIENQYESLGVFDYADPANIFQDYSVIVVNYCSGDFHLKNEEVSWGIVGKKQMRGYTNAKTVISYALRNFKDLDTLTFSGTSAGSLGLHMWSNYLIKTFRPVAKVITVLLDGWFDLPAHPTKEAKPLDYLCGLDILEPEDKADCINSRLFAYSQFNRTMVRNPDVRFAIVNGAVDSLQVMAFGVGPEEFYKSETLLMKSEVAIPNFNIYLVQTNQHVFLTRPTFSITTPDSVDGSGSASPLLSKWVADFRVGVPQPRVVCEGEQKDVTPETDVAGWGHSYCGLQ